MENKIIILIFFLIVIFLLIFGFYSKGSYSGPPIERISIENCRNSSDLSNGVYGGFTIIKGDCMSSPGKSGTCAFESYVSGKIFFFNVENNQTYTTESNERGCFEINLPNGEYYIWPDVGWNLGYIKENCWNNLSNCTEKEIGFIKSELEYMQGKICRDNSNWGSPSRCNILINDSYFRIDLTISNVAS
ncbi:MAG: hypothetical protein AABW50_00040 [Nanoarchaeota archaeon]